MGMQPEQEPEAGMEGEDVMPEVDELQKCYELFKGLGPTLVNVGVRSFLWQCLQLALHLVLLVAWPAWGLVWGVFQNQKASQVHRNLEKLAAMKMDAAESYDTWHKHAVFLDNLQGYAEWASEEDATYNHCVLGERIERMNDMIQASDVAGCVSEIRSGLHRHMAGITNPELCTYLSGTKLQIKEYQECVKRICEVVLKADISATEKYACFDHAAKSFGRSALLLSGGGALGLYHTGLCKALYEAGLMPQVVSGSSAGSIIAAIFCTKSKDEVDLLLKEELNDATNLCFKSFSLNAFDHDVFSGPQGFIKAVQRVLGGGAFMSNERLISSLRENLGDLTFIEAYQRTNKILNIAVAYETGSDCNPLQLNYITSPQVVVWSAVVASCSVPGLFTKTALLSKDTQGNLVDFNPAHSERYFDGSVAGDLPTKRLRELFNIDFFIVSQVNPHVVPFVQRDRLLPSQKRSRWSKMRKAVIRVGRYALAELGHIILLLGRIFPILSQLFLYRLMNQFYTGDITIWPGVGWLDYLGVMLNPSQKFLRHCLTRGQRKTWPYLNHVKQCTYIESLLHESRHIARTELEKEFLSTPSPGHTGFANGVSAFEDDS